MTHSMTCQEFETLLREALDDDIEFEAAAQNHLDECAACRGLVADLRAISAEARALAVLEPGRDLWSGIAARIEAPVVSLASPGVSVRTRRQLSWRTAGAAAAALVALTSAITYGLARQGGEGAPLAASRLSDLSSPASRVTNAANPTDVAANSTPKSNVVARTPSSQAFILTSNHGAPADYDREVAKLRAILDSGRTRLNPATVALLERNLRVIDSAIVQCQSALRRDPASKFLLQSLNSSYQTKVKLLRIAAAATKG